MSQESNEIKKIASQWKERLHDAQIGHYIIAERLHHWSLFIGLSTIALTTAATALTLYRPTTPETEIYTALGATSSVAAAILTTIQTFYRPSERSEIHRAQAAQYGSLKREVELALSRTDNNTQLEHDMENIRIKWESIALDSPLTNFSILKKIQEKKNKLPKSQYNTTTDS